MKHFDELSQILAAKVQKACRKHPDEKEPTRIAIDPEVLGAIHDLMEHYKDMTNGESISTKDTVSERKESELPATAERVSIQN